MKHFYNLVTCNSSQQVNFNRKENKKSVGVVWAEAKSATSRKNQNPKDDQVHHGELERSGIAEGRTRTWRLPRWVGSEDGEGPPQDEDDVDGPVDVLHRSLSAAAIREKARQMEQASQEEEDSRASCARRADVAQADDDEDDRDAEGDDVAAIHFLCQTSFQMSKGGRSFEGSAVSRFWTGQKRNSDQLSFENEIKNMIIVGFNVIVKQ